MSCAGALLLAAVAGATGTAYANPSNGAVPPAWSLVNAEVPVAANGVLLFRSGPSTGVPPLPLSVMLAGAGDETIPGRLEALGTASASQYQVWRPKGAFTEGDRFHARDGQGMVTSFNGAPAVATAAPPAATLMAKLTIMRVVLEDACCTPTGADLRSCLATKSEEHAMLTVSAAWLHPTSSSAARQFVYRLSVLEQDGGDWSMAWAPAKDLLNGITAVAQREADSYCYRLEAFGLIDRARFVIEEACIASDLRPLETVGPTLTEMNAALNAMVCPQPPPELESAWCEVNPELCDAPAGGAGGPTVTPRKVAIGCSIARHRSAATRAWALAWTALVLAIAAGMRGRGRR